MRGEAEANSCVITRLLHFVRNDTLCQIATLPSVARNDKGGYDTASYALLLQSRNFGDKGLHVACKEFWGWTIGDLRWIS